MYLWTHKDVYRKELDKLKDFYVGTDAKETVLSRFDNSLLQVSKWGKMRNPFFKKYPLLMPANSMFFFELFTRKIYGVETKDTIKARLPKSQVLDIIKEISKDYDALSVLSTHAINFMYGAERIYGDDEPLFDPSVFVDVMQNKMQKLENKEHVAMVIYLVTHCIIGASEFYSEEITRDIEIYKTLFREGEKVIQEHYADVALDAKFEFLVCARLLNQETFLEKIIYTEAENSLSPIHNFMDDTLNTNVDIKKRYPELREHTNVLYIMSRSKRNQKDIFNI